VKVSNYDDDDDDDDDFSEERIDWKLKLGT
jgi:hypothetical protein